VLFEPTPGSRPLPGLLTDRGVVSVVDRARRGHTPQATMQDLIEHFDDAAPALERKAREGEARPLDAVRLRPPLPRPGKILACIANYWEHGALEARAAQHVPQERRRRHRSRDTIVLPEHTEPWIFMHEAELALGRSRGPAKSVKRDDWKRAVFGYTA
jgi:2-keto-4-pentenoate hydratase/2-oxohepta-3-ene-1,7-dioic acid hydratase in catechol pathway